MKAAARHLLGLALAVLTATLLTAAPIVPAPVRAEPARGALSLPRTPPRPRRG
ncbi:hypothetical protein ACIGZJ_31090 [Kitasatospora sp. NPDC052868]|uniref:hypothetical protein n=1 Tax=Kitasatospora sp. NPDC052868 TaxID=3364060 RepID=UPI0037C7730E